MIKGVVFDMDGLMFDTETLSARFWREAAERLGYNMPADLPPKAIGLDAINTRKVFEVVMGSQFEYFKVRELRLKLEQEYVEEHGVPVKPGLFELLRYLREKGISVAVATSSDRSKLDRNLNSCGAAGYFDATVDGTMVTRGKPEPDIFLKACSLLGLQPEDCLALEDSPAGIRSSTSAGMTVVMIPDLGPPGDEERRLAAAILPSLECVPEFISRVNAGEQ